MPKNRNESNAALAAASSISTPKQRFEAFPLHLLTAQGWRSSPQRIQELVPGRVLVVQNVLIPKECQDWVSYCESSGGLEYTQHPATKWVAHRECYRMQQANATALASELFRRMQQLGILSMIQREMVALHHHPNYVPVGCNPNLRVYKYIKGHAFGKHVDGSDIVNDMGKTEWTVLVYLSKCQGGATRFYTDSRKRPKSVAFEPQIGSMLVHLHGEHCLEHEADPVSDGVKYVLRTDLVFNDSAG